MTSISATHPLLLIGAGKMGGAMLDGWLQTTPGEAFHVVDPFVNAQMAERLGKMGVHVHEKLPEGITPALVLIAVKPQMMDEVAPQLQSYVSADTVFVSVAAGKTIDYFQGVLGETAAIVRAMPNTPAQVGRGVTAGVANDNVSEAQREMVASFMKVTGHFGWVEEEALIDAVTAVSGSGPAYVFHMVEALAEAGIAAGLPADLSMELARGTIVGAGELLHQSPESAATLRQNVTSPAGTTAAGLEVLMGQQGLTDLMSRTVAAAKKRSEELGG